MSARSSLLDEIQQRLQQLSPERLQVLDDFLAYLEDREMSEATQELLRIPGFEEALREGENSIADGNVVRLCDVRREV